VFRLPDFCARVPFASERARARRHRQDRARRERCAREVKKYRQPKALDVRYSYCVTRRQ
jgi:hypothetical protein